MKRPCKSCGRIEIRRCDQSFSNNVKRARLGELLIIKIKRCSEQMNLNTLLFSVTDLVFLFFREKFRFPASRLFIFCMYKSSSALPLRLRILNRAGVSSVRQGRCAGNCCNNNNRLPLLPATLRQKGCNRFRI